MEELSKRELDYLINECNDIQIVRWNKNYNKLDYKGKTVSCNLLPDKWEVSYKGKIAHFDLSLMQEYKVVDSILSALAAVTV